MINTSKSTFNIEMIFWGIAYSLFGIFFPIAAMVTLVLFDWNLLGWFVPMIWTAGTILSTVYYFIKKSVLAKSILIAVLIIPIVFAIFVLIGLTVGFVKL